MRRALASLLFLFLLPACTRAEPRTISSPTPSPAASPSPSPSPSPTPIAFSIERAMEHVRVLSVDIGIRNAGSANEKRAEDYVASVMTAAGLEVTRQPFQRPNGGTSNNVIGRLKGVDYAQPYLIVGAHYDTVDDSPGANDNASGTAVMLVLAEALAGENVPIEFIAFGSEERQPGADPGAAGLTFGSRAYVQALESPAAQVAAMVSIDMIGNGPAVLIWRLTDSNDVLQRELVAAAEATGVPYRVNVRGPVSDHGPFALAGVPAAFLYSGDHPSYHSPSDVFEVVQPEAVSRTATVTLQWLKGRMALP